MLRPVAFAIGLALCSLSGWSSAHAHPSSILWKIGKSPAAAKVIDNLISRPALAEKALETLKQLKGLMREYETDAVQALRQLHPADRAALILSDDSLGLGKSYLHHSGLDTSKYTIKNWKLILHEPVEFDLPAGGKFELSEIDLKKPAASAAAYACSQVKDCIELVQKLYNTVTSPNNELSSSD
jgi:hypothetical protein